MYFWWYNTKGVYQEEEPAKERDPMPRPKNTQPMTISTVRLPDDLAETLAAYAQQENRSINSQHITLLREAIAARRAVEAQQATASTED